MPELPDIELYCGAIDRHLGGRVLEGVRLASPFLLRSVTPPLPEAHGRRLERTHRLGKRVVLTLEGEHHLVLHLMIGGRLRLREAGAKVPGRIGLAAFDFEGRSLLLTEAGKKKRASLHLCIGAEALAAHDPGGLEVLGCKQAEFDAVLDRENHTLKRTLTDPRLFSGIGNAYSDEILHHARLSPLTWTSRLPQEERARLRESCVEVLTGWRDRLAAEVGEGFPEKVTAFREEMAVHGRFGQPCPRCGEKVQRIRRADSEVNYCAPCQTGGKLLADRGLSRLLKGDWPKTLDALEDLKDKHRGAG